MATDLADACGRVEDGLGLRDPFHDPGVGEFGLSNAVYEAGDTFLEVVSPIQEGTTAGRYLERRGGDAGYMVLFQVADTAATRTRAVELGMGIVWQIDLPDISGTHLHPRDIGGAIVSFDTPDPPESWRWGGPRWTGRAPPDAAGPAITGVVVRAGDPGRAAQRWAGVLGELSDVTFEPGDDGLVAVTLSGFTGEVTICGVTFRGQSPN